ncbi:MAG: hypothetical protein AABY46_03395 [Nitrospirota bacterium]
MLIPIILVGGGAAAAWWWFKSSSEQKEVVIDTAADAAKTAVELVKTVRKPASGSSWLPLSIPKLKIVQAKGEGDTTLITLLLDHEVSARAVLGIPLGWKRGQPIVFVLDENPIAREGRYFAEAKLKSRKSRVGAFEFPDDICALGFTVRIGDKSHYVKKGCKD